MAKKKNAQKYISKEIREMMSEYKETGKITTSRATYRPKSKEHAQKIAAAIAYGSARQKGYKIKRKYKGSGYFSHSDLCKGYKIIK